MAAATDVEFVMIAESGALERQTLLLAESIRLLGGAWSDAAITVVSPRPDRRPDANTLRRLDALRADYLPLEIRSPCPLYGTSFRMAAMAEVERLGGPDVLVMLDSDTLFLSPPAFPTAGGGVALRPVDVKGMCTSGPDDPLDAYWRRLCDLCAVAYDRVPWLETTVSAERVMASHNGGLVAAERKHGLYTTSWEFFRRTLEHGLSPRAPGRPSFRIGSGQATGEAAQLWGSAQAVLSLALVALDLEARLLPIGYNVPLHMFDRLLVRHPEVAHQVVHVHYHWLCDADRLGINPLIDGRIRLPDSLRALLDRHVPLDGFLAEQRELDGAVAADR
jgi:hypothetical protein